MKVYSIACLLIVLNSKFSRAHSPCPATSICTWKIMPIGLQSRVSSQSRDSGFPNPGVGRDPGIPEHNAHVIRDSNPGPTFSIPEFGIETFLMPGSRRAYVTTQDHYNTTTCESYSPQFPHRWVRYLCGRVVLFYFRCKTGKKEVKQRSKEMQLHSTKSRLYCI
jgi:hypothetical protein